jgi:hypothetical protein
MATLFALVCGIDQYRNPVPALEGCVNDATMVADYLRENIRPDQLRLELITLLDAEATRQNILDHVEKHLGRARTGDTALFFFAGHGGQETAHEYFAPYEPDGQLETILCYDSRHGGVRDLADKELQYLLHRLSGPDPETAPHVVVVQDNCHSGSGVRGEAASPTSEWVARTVRAAAAPRPWDEFLFATAIPLPRSENPTVPPDRLLPLGRVVQLAACLSNEYAWETTHKMPDGRVFKGGIFTRRLLEGLRRHHGQLTYHDLQSEVRGRIGGSSTATQTPNLYVSTHPSDAFRTFLYGEGQERPTYCHVQWNSLLGWHMDLGAFHQIPSDARISPVRVLVRETLQSTQSYTAQTVAVEAGRSKLVFLGEEPPQDLTLVGEIQQLHRERLPVYFDAPVRQSGHLDRLVQNGGDRVKPLLEGLAAVASETEARYVLRTDGTAFFVTLPGDQRPLALQQGPLGEPAALRALEQLAHIARWETTRRLFNPATRLRPLPPVLLEGFREPAHASGEPVPLPIQDGTIQLDTSSTVQFRLRNLSPKPLFVSALLLDGPFGISPAPVAGQVARLETGQSVYLDFGTGNPSLDIRVPRWVKEFRWETYDFHLKILMASSIFDVATLQLPTLPPPVLANGRSDEDEPLDGHARGLVAAADIPDWAAYTVKVCVRYGT